MTMRKSSAWLALLMSFLIALPPAAFADDTELFTTSANPNVLLMLDTTGSMDTAAGGTSVGDLDGDGTSNTRMDILWKVIYTLLNSDLSIPSPSGVTITATTDRARRWASSTVDTNISSTRQYQYVQVNTNAATWSQFPGSTTSGGTVIIGSGGLSENMTYTSRSSGSPYRFYFSSAKTFSRTYNQGSTVSYTFTPSYTENYPTNSTQATSSDFLNNLSTADENILKARLGLMTFTTNSTGSTILINTRNQIQPTDNNTPPFNTSYRNIWSSTTTYAHASGGTPTAQALQRAQGFFDTATTNNTVDICRQNFAVMVTDGEDTMGGLDGATGNGFGPAYYNSGVFKADGWSSGSNTGQVARNNAVIQEAANLKTHAPSVNLFTVGVGISDNQPHLSVMREVLRRAAEQNNAQATNAYFTDTIGAGGDNTSRAANKAFFATDAEQLSTALRNIFQQITAGMYSFTAPTVASVRMTDRNYLYKASFTPAPPPATYWEGHLQALTINPDDTISAALWDADNVLRDTNAADRRIYTGSTSDNVTWSRLDFTTSGVTPEMLAVDNNAARDNVVNYVLGVGRSAKLGDIFHSKPVVVGPPSQFFFDAGYSTAVGGDTSFVNLKAHRKRVVYVGTNDGMLHAFLSGSFHTDTNVYDSGTGEELFGYVPIEILDNLESFVPGDLTRHGYFVDSSPRVADVWIDTNGDEIKQTSEWRTILIGGLRKGGNGFFALDVTDPGDGILSTDYSIYPKVLWEYQDEATMGQSWSEPFIGKVKMKETDLSPEKDRWVAIFGGGMSESGEGGPGASLVVLDIATGTPLTTFTTGIDNAIPASPTAVLDASGYIRFVYVSDLNGSLYKFRFTSTGVRSDGFSQWDMKKIFQAPAGQPVYHRVESATISESNRYLFFGTGDQETPVSNLGTGKFYAIQETDGFWPGTPLTESNLTNLSSSITNVNGGTVAVGRSGWFVSFASVPSTSNDTNTHTGEKVLSDPVVFFNNVFFTTFTPDVSNACGGGGIARVYGLNIQTAGAGLAVLSALGETGTKVPYHVYTGSTEGSPGGIPSSPSLSIYPSGQSSIFIGFSTGAVQEVKIESPTQMKTIKSWKETF